MWFRFSAEHEMAQAQAPSFLYGASLIRLVASLASYERSQHLEKKGLLECLQQSFLLMYGVLFAATDLASYLSYESCASHACFSFLKQPFSTTLVLHAV